MTSTLPVVGFIGLGNMGWHMAGHLVNAGFTVIGLDASVATTERFNADHSLPNAGPDAFATVDAIVTMLPTSAIVAEAILGESSLIRDVIRPGTLVVDMSSSKPLETRELGVRLAEHGIHLVDAPVSGGTLGAEKATLTIMIGADNEEGAARAETVVAPMSNRVFRVGKLGAGHATKALNNFVAAAGFVAGSEALLAAKAYGLDPEVFLNVLSTSTGRNFSTEVTLKEEVLTGAYNSGFALVLMTKDVSIAADLAKKLGTTSVVAESVVAQLTSALEDLGPTADHTAAVKSWAK